MFCQLNEWTKDIEINDRYIFGDDAYKVRERSRFDRRYTFDENSVGMISFYLDYDNKGENDNIDLGIADYRKYDYTISSVKSVSNTIGFSDKLEYNICLNDADTDELATWSSTDESIAVIDKDTGKYTLVGIGSCEFVATMVNKPEVYVSIPVTVEKKLIVEYEDILSPEVEVIKLNKTVEFSIYETLNGEQTNTPFDIKAYNVPLRNYKLVILDGNNFRITNLKPYDQDLEIVCTNLNRKDKDGNLIETRLNIRLGGLV